MPKLKWYGVLPKKCEICGKPLRGYFVDGRTKMGPWATMCTNCHDKHGVGLGLGKGQKYSMRGGQKII